MREGRLTHALRGLRDAFLNDSAVQLHATIAVLVLLAAVVACLSAYSWALLLLVIGSVLAAELRNSSLERLADRIHPARDKKIQRAKDLSASAVLVLAIVSVFVGIILFLPPILSGTAMQCLVAP